jgi:hypothetical protein
MNVGARCPGRRGASAHVRRDLDRRQVLRDSVRAGCGGAAARPGSRSFARILEGHLGSAASPPVEEVRQHDARLDRDAVAAGVATSGWSVARPTGNSRPLVTDPSATPVSSAAIVKRRTWPPLRLERNARNLPLCGPIAILNFPFPRSSAVDVRPADAAAHPSGPDLRRRPRPGRRLPSRRSRLRSATYPRNLWSARPTTPADGSGRPDRSRQAPCPRMQRAQRPAWAWTSAARGAGASRDRSRRRAFARGGDPRRPEREGSSSACTVSSVSTPDRRRGLHPPSIFPNGLR